MAGGFEKITALTNSVPKPMIKIGEKPILEIIINNFKNLVIENLLFQFTINQRLLPSIFLMVISSMFQ